MDKENALNITSKFRDPYSLEEDSHLVDYFLARGGFSRIRGNSIWMTIERSNILPGRSWQSLKNRFQKSILKKMGNLEFGVTVEELKEADRKIYGVESDEDKDEDEDAGEKEKPIRRPYSIAEDKKILGYILENKRFADTGGRAFWINLEESNVLNDRTWQSMKERFRKVLIKNIENYNLSEDDVRRFKAGGEIRVLQKRHKKT